MTTSIYKGFWSPTQVYSEGDIVEYYASNSYNGKGRYKLLSETPVGPITTPDEGSDSCPLKNFTYPVLSPDGALKLPANYSPQSGDLLIFLSQADLFERVGDPNGAAEEKDLWELYVYYKAGIWEGPNGLLSTVQVNSVHWQEVTDSPNSGWDSPSEYNVSGQEFSSDSLVTLSSGKYGDAASDVNVEFDSVQGETDSDAYYLSTIQNYSGYFDRTNDYKKFDIVRDGYSNLFYYARRNINPNSADSTDGSSFEELTIVDFVIRPPVDYAYNESHVGTLENKNNTISFSDTFRVGDVLDFSEATEVTLKEANKGKFNVIGVGPDLLWLGSFESATEDALMEVQGYESDGSISTISELKIKRYSADIKAYGSCTIEGNNDKASCEKATDDNGNKGVWTEHNDSIWSHDKFFFDADYGSTVNFAAKNKQHQYGEGYTSVSPLGINSVGIGFDLKFTNRSNREANAILHFLENHLGQHETNKKSYYLDSDQGISGFHMDGDCLFFPYNNPENLSRRFHCFDYGHSIENEDVHNVTAKIQHTNASTLGFAEQIFVNKAPVWSANKTYSQHDVVFCPDNYQYYYSFADGPNSTFRPWSSDADGNVTSINKDKWTREFYWSPSLSLDVGHQPAVDQVKTAASPYTQYYPGNKQNISLLSFNLSFENRTDEEAYSILHFLESHLGYKSFLFIPPAPYNRKRRFYCEEWSHTYVFRNNHTIKASFVQYPLGQNTPLDDDEMDSIAPAVIKSPGQIALQETVDFNVFLSPSDISNSQSYVAKAALVISNVGETDVLLENPVAPLDDKFTISSWGQYADTVEHNFGDGAGLQTYAIQSPPLDSLGSNNSIIFRQIDSSDALVNSDRYYVKTALGQVYVMDDSLSSPDDKVLLPSTDPNVIEGHFYIDDGGAKVASYVLKPGEDAVIEAFFNSANSVTSDNPSAEFSSTFSISYSSAPTNENKWSDSVVYSEGNEVQYGSPATVYELTAASSTVGSFVHGEWSAVKHSKVCNLRAVVNPSLLDEKKKSISIEINSAASGEATASFYSVHDNLDNVFEFHQREDLTSLYGDIKWNASEEGSFLPAPNDLSEFEEVLESHTDLSGYLFLGIEYDGAEYKDVYSGEVVDILSRDGFGVHFEFPSASQDAFDSTRPHRKVAIHTEKNAGRFQVALLDENSDKAVGHVREVRRSDAKSRINIANAVALSPEIGEYSLEDIKEIEVTMVGVFVGDNVGVPVVDLGLGYREDASITINIGKKRTYFELVGDGTSSWGKTNQGQVGDGGKGAEAETLEPPSILTTDEYNSLSSSASEKPYASKTDGSKISSVDFNDLSNEAQAQYTYVGGQDYYAEREWFEPCYIIGKGGRGGGGMRTEGSIKERGEITGTSVSMSAPENGEKGGDAIKVSGGLGERLSINILDGGIFGGGGGGGGGGYIGTEKRLPTAGVLNMAGGGGGGAGNGLGGFPLGQTGSIDPAYSSGSQAGETINNSTFSQSHLVGGGAGGAFGEAGEDPSGSGGVSILGQGGAAGRAIVWAGVDAPILRDGTATLTLQSDAYWKLPDQTVTTKIKGKSEKTNL